MPLSSSPATAGKLSKEEVAQYDRQLRVWGVAGQQRLRCSNVCIVGVRGLAGEICKNLVLAGIGTLTLLDARCVQASDLGAQFFLRPSDIGSNFAVASAPRIQELNPNVKVIADTADVSNKTADFFEQFDVVCLTDCSRKLQIKIDDFCRQASKRKPAFFAAETFGWYCYMYQDLHEYQYIKKKKQKTDEENTEEKTEKCVSIAEISKCPWNAVYKCYGRRKKTSAELHLAFQVIHEFRDRTNQLPTSDEDIPKLLSIRDELADDGKINKSISDEFLKTLGECSGCEINPICAIFGGLLGAEILSVLRDGLAYGAVSKKRGRGNNNNGNVLVYSGDRSVAVTRRVPQ